MQPNFSKVLGNNIFMKLISFYKYQVMASLVFRLCENAPEILRDVCLDRGWKEYEEDDENDWHLWWKSSGFRASDFEACRPWQRINHFPKSNAITRKDCLARNLRRMKGVYGKSVYNFAPLSFNLPNDYTKFVSEYSKQKEAGKTLSWICKPADQSRGKGIFIFRDLSQLTYDCATVVQKYIPNPMLIAGYKFDLRIYVLVTSFRPLHIYAYHQGLVRFGTQKFDLNCLDNVFSHLTNTSINKQSPCYATDKERIGSGCKWSIGQLRTYFHQNSIDDRLLWHRINAIIILTLLTQAPEVQAISTNCFELFGFDVLIDSNLKPWLLEVNFSPSLGIDCDVDIAVKKPLLQDTLDIINLKESDISTLNNCILNIDCEKRDKILKHARPTYNYRMLPSPSPRQLTGNRNTPHVSKSRASTSSSMFHSRRVIGDSESESNLSISSGKSENTNFSNDEIGINYNDDDDEQNDYDLPTKTNAVLENNKSKLSATGCDEESMKKRRGQSSLVGIEDTRTVTSITCINHSPLLQSNASLEFQEVFCCSKTILDTSTLSKAVSNPDACNLKNQGTCRYSSMGKLYMQNSISFGHPESSIDGEDENFGKHQPISLGCSSKKSICHSSRCQSTSLPPLKKSFVKTNYAARRRSAQITPYLPAKSYETPKKTNTRKFSLMNLKGRNESKCKGFSKMKLCSRVGDYVLVFPFNDASQKSSSPKQLNSKAAIDEVKKAIHKVTELIKASPKSTCTSFDKDTVEQPLDLNKPYWGFSSIFNYLV